MKDRVKLVSEVARARFIRKKVANASPLRSSNPEMTRLEEMKCES